MSYCDTVRDASTFAQRGKGSDNLSALVHSRHWKSAVSQWGREHFTNACINALVQGPESIDALKYQVEPQLVQHYKPDSLGYVWAALTPFVRAGAGSIQDALSDTAVREASKRASKRPVELQDFVPSDQVTFGSSPDYKHRPATSGSNETHSSAGYVEGLVAPLVEDATVRLASCFIRCVLNYGQYPDQAFPFLYFRDERQTYSFSQGNLHIHAVDDGGIQVIDANGDHQHVAMLEGKRTFAKVIDGIPIVSDELLGQMVGEALAVRCSDVLTVSTTDFITILAASHFIKFFHFHISDNYQSSYDQLHTNPDDYLHVYSTVWFDIKNNRHREDVVAHIFALIAWAQEYM
ncbi:hypothetical protein HIM_08403 [Hirsutella minnesotensis 3608]|uniref:Uncharacterized protein n=1 Tax=Hirsutella minnesotensis 3608 TaxID=1043627 RepID=A0A0F7ZSX8_9HYPO|nr:hypothetical protein HIM_08403 [Hirsutella minnesotensis 3608]